MANEFDELDINDKFEDKETVPTTKDNEMISTGGFGAKYNWEDAPTTTKMPPRKDLDGKQCIIDEADIILPPKESAWLKTKKGDKEYKSCQFILRYDVNGDKNNVEKYSGIRVFKRENLYSHPTCTRDRQNQASVLLGLYADFKQKDISEVPLREFMAFLNSKPKAMLKTEEVKNPETGEKIKKNVVAKFL